MAGTVMTSSNAAYNAATIKAQRFIKFLGLFYGSYFASRLSPAALQKTKAELSDKMDHFFVIIFALAEAGADVTVNAGFRAR